MKRSLLTWMALVASGSVLGCLLTGCAWSIGDQKDGKVIAQPTRGQELIDLKKAKDLGAISQEEYDAQKKAIMAK